MKWRVWEEGVGPNNGGDVYAHSASEAAEKYAEEHDRAAADYPTSRVLCVCDADGVLTKFEVMLESVPRYWAQEIP